MQAKKFFGQNFITDKNLILKIISLLNNDGNTLVVEVGPGRGALTLELVNQFKEVVAIEIDKDLESLLKTKIESNNFTLIIEDILNIEMKELLHTKINDYKNIVLISNTPYYITSEIIFNTFKNSDIFTQAVFMVQKEVAERICAKANENNYNNLSVAAQYYSQPKYEFTVKKHMFSPEPKVDSAIISFDLTKNYKKSVAESENFINFVRKLFNQKRKTILNNLKNYNANVDYPPLLKKVGIEPTLRPENITIDQFISLYNVVIK